jgi:lipopolysaccharide export system permease protein
MDQFKADPGIALLQEGRFMELDKGRTVAYIQELSNRSTDLKKIFVVQQAENGKPPSLVVSDTGKVSIDKDGLQWLTLNDGTRYEGQFTGKAFRISDFSSYGVVIQQRNLEESKRKSTAKPTSELLQSGLSKDLMAELQWRISLPLSIPVLTYLVVPLARVNPRQGRYAKLLPAILLYLSYFLLLSAGRSAIASGALPYWPGMLLIPLGYLLLIGLPLNLQDTAWWNRTRRTLRKPAKA